MIGGAQYPASFSWTPNLYFVRHVAPPDHAAFYSSSRFTLNVTRRAMAGMGWCPSGRLFEAASCGVPVISDWWDGLETFFAPGRELLVARTREDVLAALSLDDAERQRIARAARDRALASHTADQRARDLEAAVVAVAPRRTPLSPKTTRFMGNVSRCNQDATVNPIRDVSSACLDRLVDGLADDDRLVVVVAHPDDETIGCGAQLSCWAHALTLVHVTDGSPPRDEDRTAAGCATARDYAALRRRELLSAMRLAGVRADRLVALGVGDQRAVHSIAAMARRLASLFADTHATIVVTQPYEGGHPDHDATALAVHLAISAMANTNGSTPGLAECTAYHAGEDGTLVTGRFLQSSTPARMVWLDAAGRDRRARMLSCFVSQQRTLVPFTRDHEALRVAPAYDFAHPPHDGRVHYEHFRWGVRDAADWCATAAREAAAFLATRPSG